MLASAMPATCCIQLGGAGAVISGPYERSKGWCSGPTIESVRNRSRLGWLKVYSIGKTHNSTQGWLL